MKIKDILRTPDMHQEHWEH